jgi:hypothetical protein
MNEMLSGNMLESRNGDEKENRVLIPGFSADLKR